MLHISFDEDNSEPLLLTFDQYTLLAFDHLPADIDIYRTHTTLIEHKEDDDLRHADNFLFLAVYRTSEQWPLLIVSQKYGPGAEGAFYPGVLIIPETSLLFLGAGERLLAYQLDPPAKLWEDRADIGFWGWERYRDVLVMSAELELAVWDIRGKKLWTTFVEPPWDYHLDENTIHINVMGSKASFPLYEGPPAAVQWWL